MLRCSHGKICWCLRMVPPDPHSGARLLMVGAALPSRGWQGAMRVGNAQTATAYPRDTEPGDHALFNILPFCLPNGWRLLQEHAVFVCAPERGRRMLLIRCWRTWLRIRDVCQPLALPESSAETPRNVPQPFFSRKKKKQPLSQRLSSLQTRADFDECLDFKVCWGIVSLLTEHFLSAALVNRFENDSQTVQVYLFQM